MTKKNLILLINKSKLYEYCADYIQFIILYFMKIIYKKNKS